MHRVDLAQGVRYELKLALFAAQQAYDFLEVFRPRCPIDCRSSLKVSTHRHEIERYGAPILLQRPHVPAPREDGGAWHTMGLVPEDHVNVLRELIAYRGQAAKPIQIMDEIAAFVIVENIVASTEVALRGAGSQIQNRLLAVDLRDPVIP
jgi:hypothetical protein